MKRLILTLVLLSPLSALSVVDMKNANFAHSQQFIAVPGTGFDLKLQGNYSSRSLFIGFLGFGWCTDLETNIEKTAEGNLKLQECGAGQEIVYTPGKSDTKEVERSVTAILEYAKKSNPGANSKYLATLREQLKEDYDLRVRWAKEAKLTIPEIQKGIEYRSTTISVEKIVFDGSFYTRTLVDNTSQKFDANGLLTFIYDKNQNYLKINRSGDLIKDVVDNNGKKLTFEFYPNKRVKQVTGPSQSKAEFKYKGEDLVEAKTMWKTTYTYTYDDLHNLTRLNYPDGTFKALTYNKNNDWVTSFTDRALKGPACTESYNYELDKQNPKDHYWSTAIRKCGKDTVHTARYEFWHRAGATGKYLYRVLSKTNDEEMDVTYHEEFGRPLSIKKDGLTTAFAYFPNGLVKEKSTSSAKLSYEYKNTFNKVSRVITEFFDSKGKPLRKRETKFDYDNKANLIFASNSDGQTVRLSYDLRGRIATIVDQAKKEVLIKYEERTGKPAQITRPSVGTISVTYKPSGEIDKVDSKEGPSVAVQVASTFNNLLDIIAPATSELSL